MEHDRIVGRKAYRIMNIERNLRKDNGMIFETHAHYDDKVFDEDREALLSSMRANGIGTIVNVTAEYSAMEATLELTEKYDFIYGTVGVHPSETEELTEGKIQRMKELAKCDKIVAIGEIGLDYYYSEPPHDIQKKWFIKQLAIAKELNMPVVIHSRDAASDTLEILKSDAAKGLCGVIHCYSYSKEMAMEFEKLGYYFGIGGVITFQNAKKLVETVEYLPLEKIVLETDSPYLSPAPNRGKRNSSLNIPFIAQRIAEIKKVPYKEVVEITERNAQNLYFGTRKRKSIRLSLEPI